MNEQQQTNRPIKTYRNGSLSLSIWENRSQKGGTFNTATFQRSYTKQDGSWTHTQSLRIEDMPILGDMLREAYADSMNGKLKDAKDAPQPQQQPQQQRPLPNDAFNRPQPKQINQPLIETEEHIITNERFNDE